MAFHLSRIDRIYRHYDVTATLPDGAPATLAGVDVALLEPRRRPDTETVWTSATYTDGSATVLLAGPDADPTNALPVAEDRDLWIRVTDSPEVQAIYVEKVTVA